MSEKIPDEVLEILKTVWKTNGEYSSFDSVWGEEDTDYDKERRLDPSYYFFRKDNLEQENNGPTGTEVCKLSALPLFDGMIFEHKGSFSFNEHAQHALCDFLSSVYDSYRELASNLDLIREQNQKSHRWEEWKNKVERSK